MSTVSSQHERLTELFAEAISLAPDARRELIERVKSADAALADELVSLLDSDAKAGIHTGAFMPTLRLRAVGPEGAPRVPGYRVLGVLGEGGMGTVYAGEQIEPRRPVAVKVLHARSQMALLRFKTEAQIMARLDHPGIARVLEAGDAEGRPFLVMELVEGVMLDAFAKQLPLARRLALFAELCDAVHHAHVHGVIHRDLKPSNIMVREDARVVVLDFGVARLSDDSSSPGATRDGELVGTPLYMSPEQARLRPDQVDARSDVYTLGVIFYELACGELPYDIRELPLSVITGIIATDDPIPLGRRDSALRGDLEAIAGKALAKEPRDRYQSAAALADDIRHYLAGESVSVRAPGALEQLQRFVRRRPLVASAIASAVVVAGAFAAVVTALWLEARTARRSAEGARARAESAAQVAETARAQLEARTNDLVLRQAREAIARDPTEAIAWLASATDRGLDANVSAEIAREAIARGVAHDVVHGHDDEVHWVEPLPGAGSDAFVTGGYDGRALVWTGSPPIAHAAYTAKQGRVHAVRPSPDGRELAIGGDSGSLHVVSPDGHVLATLTGHAGDVQHLAWSPDGAWLVTGDDHGHVLAWPHGRAPAIALLAAPPSAIGDVQFAASGAAAAGGDHAGNIWLWELPSGVAHTAHVGAGVNTVWTDGTHVDEVDDTGVVRTFHVAGPALALDTAVPTGFEIKRAAFERGGRWVVLGGVGGGVERVEGTAITELAHHAAQVRSIAISPDDRWVASGGEDGSLEVRDLRRDRTIALRGHTGRIRHLAFVGGALLSSDSEGTVRRWELATAGAGELDAYGAPVERLARSADGTALAAADSAGDVVRWNLADSARTALGHADGRVVALAFAGDTVVTGTSEGTITWWSATPVVRRVHGVVKAISASAERVAVATSNGPIELFALDGAPAGVLGGDPGGTEAVAFSADGALLASGGQDRAIHVWRRGGAGAFGEIAVLPGPRGDTHYVAFSDDGAALVSAGNGGRVLAWQVPRAGEPFGDARELAQHRGAVTAIAIAPHGTAVASAGRDGTVTRVSLRGPAASASIALPAAAISLAFDSHGAIHAITRDGAAVRWPPGGAATTEIGDGAIAGVALPDDRRWVIAFEDGALLVADLDPLPLADLRARLAAATTYQLPK